MKVFLGLIREDYLYHVFMSVTSMDHIETILWDFWKEVALDFRFCWELDIGLWVLRNHFDLCYRFIFLCDPNLFMCIFLLPLIEENIGVSMRIPLTCVFSFTKSLIFEVWNIIIPNNIVIEFKPFFILSDVLHLTIFYYRVVMTLAGWSVVNNYSFKFILEVIFFWNGRVGGFGIGCVLFEV